MENGENRVEQEIMLNRDVVSEVKRFKNLESVGRKMGTFMRTQSIGLSVVG